MTAGSGARPELRGLLLPELEALAERLGEPRYRGRQVGSYRSADVEYEQLITDITRAREGVA